MSITLDFYVISCVMWFLVIVLLNIIFKNRNMDLIFSFPGGDTCRGFFIVSLLVEMAASPGIMVSITSFEVFLNISLAFSISLFPGPQTVCAFATCNLLMLFKPLTLTRGRWR